MFVTCKIKRIGPDNIELRVLANGRWIETRLHRPVVAERCAVLRAKRHNSQDSEQCEGRYSIKHAAITNCSWIILHSVDYKIYLRRFHLPMQKEENIFFNVSSLVICEPVISPSV